jgi:hypothetical protein
MPANELIEAYLAGCAAQGMTREEALTELTVTSPDDVDSCWGTVTENPAAEYVRRTDTIVPDAGEAMKVNAATHVVDPGRAMSAIVESLLTGSAW